ncbi:MAG: cytochrome c3 family protein [Bacteroidota bacterium]|nr:cytochrome c3 family protein [Bacteroidota bacterium]
MTNTRIITTILVTGILLALLSLGQSALQSVNLPGNNQGYEPAQPLPYSHRLHAGELGIDCLYCHFGAERSRNAGVPPMNVCMNCHGFITAPIAAVREEDRLAEEQGRKAERIISSALRPLYDALGVANNPSVPGSPTMEGTPGDGSPGDGTTPQPIRWIRIHQLPDFVYFDHRAHVTAGVDCQSCHGPVETMERVRQVEDLSMGWCVNCHRQSNADGIGGQAVNAPTDCVGCHY